MVLTDKMTAAAAAPAFEGEENTATAAPAATTTAVATKPATAVSAPAIGMVDVIAAYKDRMPVEYNTLAQVKCTNGNFVERETAAPLGDTVVFTLMSWQDAYVISPQDDKAPKEQVKFSDDGITCSDGTLVSDYLAELKADGWQRAGIKKRMTVVGAIESASKTDKYNGVPVQFDLSPETRVLFQRYQATVAYNVSIGKYDAQKVGRIKAVTRLVTKGNNTYTVADFSVA